MKWKIVLPLLLLVAVAGGFLYYHKLLPALSSGADASAADAVLTAKVERRTLVRTVDTAGDISPPPALQVDVKPEISYKINKIWVTVGQQVKAGDKLVDLDDSDILTNKTVADRQVEAAQLALEKSKRDFERSQNLFNEKLVSQETYDDAKTSLDAAQNSYEEAKNSLQQVLDQLTKTKILAPINGEVLSIPVVEGQEVIGTASVSLGTILMTIADLSSMVINAQINQVDIAYLRKGQPVTFTVESIKDVTMNGMVDLIYPVASIKNNVKGFQVQILINNPNKALRPGMTADVVIPVQTSTNALAVPLAAIFVEDDGTNTVYLPAKEKDGLPIRREVKLGIINYDYAEVLSGLSEGDTVLLTKPLTFKSG